MGDGRTPCLLQPQGGGRRCFCLMTEHKLPRDCAALCPVFKRTEALTPAFQSLANGRLKCFPLLESSTLNEFSGPWKMPNSGRSRFHSNLFLSSSGRKRGALRKEASARKARKGVGARARERKTFRNTQVILPAWKWQH